jgi:hypothetical protein
LYQISSQAGDKWPFYSIALIFKMAVAAIFEDGATFPVLRFLDSICASSYVHQVSLKLGYKCLVNPTSLVFQPKYAEMGGF